MRKTLNEENIIELFIFKKKLIMMLMKYRITYFNEKIDSILTLFINL